MKILFIGNSHTYVHYVPLRVKEFMRNHGVDAEIIMLTHPGMGLDWHMEQSQTYFNVMYGGFDTIILQHNAHPFPGKDQLIEAGKSIASIIPEGVKKYVYMTWSEKHNPEGQEAMSLAYEELAEVIDAEVCPVGRIWQQVKGLHPEEELYLADGEHSSVFGASLSAVVIGRCFLGMELDPEECYKDARELEKLPQDPRMIDMVIRRRQIHMQNFL